MAQLSASQKDLVDDAIEHLFGHDHAKLADAMFDLATSPNLEEHYRVLAKHISKRAFLARYVERLAVGSAFVGQSSQLVQAGGIVERQGTGAPAEVLMETVSDSAANWDGIIEKAYSDTAGFAAELDSVEYETFSDVPQVVPLATVAETAPEIEAVELRARGESAAAEELVMMEDGEPAQTQVMMELRPRGSSTVAEELVTMDADEPSQVMLEMRPRGNTGMIEEMALETHEEALTLVSLQPAATETARIPVVASSDFALASPTNAGGDVSPTKADVAEEIAQFVPVAPAVGGPAAGGESEDPNSVHMVQELKEIAPPLEMIDLQGEAPAPEAASRSSLFNPPARLFADAEAKPINFGGSSTASVAHSRLLNSRADEEDERDDEEADEFRLASSVGVQGRSLPSTREAAPSATMSVPQPTLHEGIPGTYERSTESGKWMKAPSSELFES